MKHKSAKAKRTYDPESSNLTQTTLLSFVQGNNFWKPVDAVPGIGPANTMVLNKQGIHTVNQLIGQFLLLKNGHMTTPLEHEERFYTWLDDIGIRSNRTNIVRSIADKVSACMPNFDDAYPA